MKRRVEDATRPFLDNQIIVDKLDSKGRTVWEKTLGSSKVDWASAPALTEDGHVVVLGHITSDGAGSFDGLLMKIADGNPIPKSPSY